METNMQSNNTEFTNGEANNAEAANTKPITDETTIQLPAGETPADETPQSADLQLTTTEAEEPGEAGETEHQNTGTEVATLTEAVATLADHSEAASDTPDELPVAEVAAVLAPSTAAISTDRHFITADTVPVLMQELRTSHIIPSHGQDNEPFISQSQFVELAMKITAETYPDDQILEPAIRVSHPQKGRIPSAKDKRVEDLQPEEITVYCDRMVFGIEIQSIKNNVGENPLSLIVGGIKVYSRDNMTGKKGPEHFKFFVGYVNMVCANLCVSLDGVNEDLTASNMEELEAGMRAVLNRYNSETHILQLREFHNCTLTRSDFTKFIGKANLYILMTTEEKRDLPEFLFNDSQISVICKDYLRDKNFGRDENGSITLWQFYNLLTESVKKTHLKEFMNKATHAFTFVDQLREALQQGTYHWFLD
jgi:hypothetical protein